MNSIILGIVKTFATRALVELLTLIADELSSRNDSTVSAGLDGQRIKDIAARNVPTESDIYNKAYEQ